MKPRSKEAILVAMLESLHPKMRHGPVTRDLVSAFAEELAETEARLLAAVDELERQFRK